MAKFVCLAEGAITQYHLNTPLHGCTPNAWFLKCPTPVLPCAYIRTSRTTFKLSCAQKLTVLCDFCPKSRRQHIRADPVIRKHPDAYVVVGIFVQMCDVVRGRQSVQSFSYTGQQCYRWPGIESWTRPPTDTNVCPAPIEFARNPSSTMRSPRSSEFRCYSTAYPFRVYLFLALFGNYLLKFWKWKI